MSTQAPQQRESVLPAKSLILPSSLMTAASRGRLVVPRHIVTIERFVLSALRAGDQMITIEAPVRCGKSTYVDWYLPFWLLGSFPWKHVGLASHEAHFAQSWGAKVRDSMIEFGSSFGVEVARDIRSRSWWEIEGHDGSMRSFGIEGGGITGRGFDVLILDDLIKNAKDADSPVIRKSQVEFLQGTAVQRLEPGALLIVMMARWHEDDLIGWIHREMPGQFRRLRLPAIAEEPDEQFPEPDAMGRAPGEPLWPQRFPLRVLRRRRKRAGEYYFNANYQQRPSPPQGSIFHRDWWQYWTELPSVFDQECWSWDMSFKGQDDSSFVVGQCWGTRGADFYLRHQVRGQWAYPETKKQLVAAVSDPRFQRAAGRIYIEDKANGPAIMADLKHELPGMIPVAVGQDSKAARARSISGYVEAGNVFIPANAEWVPGFVDEHAVFPKGAHDDEVDTLSQGLRKLLDGMGGEVVVPMGDLPPRG